MIDQETPTPGRDRDDKPSDELFEDDFLPDADGDFLGELDRVLTTEDDDPGHDPQLADVEDALESLELEVEPEPDPEPAQRDAWTQPTPVPAAGRSDHEVPPMSKAVDRLQGLREHRRSVQPPVEKPPHRPERIPPVAAVVRSPAAGAGPRTPPPSAAPSKRAGTARPGPASALEKGSTPPITRKRTTAVGTAAPRTGAPPHPAEGPPPRSGRLLEIPHLWLGALGLLAIIGIVTGFVGIWLQSDTDTELARMETRLAEVSGPRHDARDAADAERLRMLEAEVARLRSLQEEFRGTLVQRLIDENERLNQDLERLEATLTELQGGLESAQVRLADAEKHPKGAQRPARTVTPAPAAGSGAVAEKGGWTVNLMSFRRRAVAEKEIARLRGDGIPATLKSIERKGQTWYRLQVSGFADVAQAKAYAKKIRARRDLSSAWVGRD